MGWNVVAIVALLGVADLQAVAAAQDPVQPVPCAVTAPNGVPATGEEASKDTHGNSGVSVFLGWPDGTVTFKRGGPGFVLEDGALAMKFGWFRGVRGQLAIRGRRLDADGPPLRARIPGGYGNIGFQSSAIIFPTPGCWEVTGTVADASLTFVVRVIKNF